VAATAQTAGGAFRLPPQAREAEESVLGGLLLDSGRYDEVTQVLRAEDFYTHAHRTIFRAIGALVDAGEPADVITVSEWLETNQQLEAVGGLAYLGELAQSTPSAANLSAYGRIVRDRAILRGLIESATAIIERAYQPEGRSPSEVLDFAEKTIFDIAQNDTRRSSAFQPLKRLLTQAVERVDELYQSDRALTGLSSGFADLDEWTAGLQNSDLIIVAGRPSMGKTSLAMNIAESVAFDEKKTVAVFSMEMPGLQLAMRMLSSLSRVNFGKLRSGRVEDGDWARIMSTLQMLENTPIYIDDSAALTPMEIRSRARRLAREHGLGLVVVDYIQLMQAGESNENRATEISIITRSLKGLAKELNVPVIALSQLNRSLEQRPNKRPVMSDLRESGAIEQDADVILFVYRDEVYHEDSADRGTAELIIGKQRNGPIGTVRLAFRGEFTRFENYAPGDATGGYG
jgi:replicative DNA helicase